jgi:glutathione S-transferase
MILVIGNKNYSSWSLRPWIALRVFGFEFDEKRILLDVEGSKAAILQHSPSGKVPVLVDGKTTVWDSLAILEYLAEKNRKLWPAEAAERAWARSLSAEMHSGFPNLRNHMSMNVRKRYPGKGRTPEVLAEIERIKAMWNEAKRPFLFGPFSAADAMYAPVVLRFRTYEVDLPKAARSYYDAMLELPAMREWIAAAERETESIPQFDMYE